MHAITVCLTAGGTLDSLSIWDPERFLDEVERHRCDVSLMVSYRDVLQHIKSAELLLAAHHTGSSAEPIHTMGFTASSRPHTVAAMAIPRRQGKTRVSHNK